MPSKPWYVITGAPSSGKTTLIEALAARGHQVAFEAARIYIDEELAKGRTIEEIREDEGAFQDEVLARKIELESGLPTDSIVFLDRGIPDSDAYYRFRELPASPLLEGATSGDSYRKVFLLEPLPYVADYARVESAEDQKRIHDLLADAYDRIGLTPVFIPVMPIEERVEFILNNL